MICNVCGEQFADSQIRRGYDDYPYGERLVTVCTHGVCPVCGSDDLRDECVCAQCGEEVLETDMNDGFCRYCAEETEQTLDWMCSMLSPAQRRWIMEHPEWIERGEMGC